MFITWFALPVQRFKQENYPKSEFWVFCSKFLSAYLLKTQNQNTTIILILWCATINNRNEPYFKNLKA